MFTLLGSWWGLGALTRPPAPPGAAPSESPAETAMTEVSREALGPTTLPAPSTSQAPVDEPPASASAKAIQSNPSPPNPAPRRPATKKGLPLWEDY